MSNLQAFLLGIMVALTPSAIILAILLWRAPELDEQFDEQSSRSGYVKKMHELPLVPDISGHELHEAEYWHHCADGLRAMAEQMSDADTRETMLGIAASYEHLARRQDSR